ncbi:hypothetical protein DFH27DRAFT_583538 [Peziza echinospora]|nr:hypothetical protein DFH27DRAFT_583538 [Peziza echinospora]
MPVLEPPDHYFPAGLVLRCNGDAWLPCSVRIYNSTRDGIDEFPPVPLTPDATYSAAPSSTTSTISNPGRVSKRYYTVCFGLLENPQESSLINKCINSLAGGSDGWDEVTWVHLVAEIDWITDLRCEHQQPALQAGVQAFRTRYSMYPHLRPALPASRASERPVAQRLLTRLMCYSPQGTELFGFRTEVWEHNWGRMFWLHMDGMRKTKHAASSNLTLQPQPQPQTQTQLTVMAVQPQHPLADTMVANQLSHTPRKRLDAAPAGHPLNVVIIAQPSPACRTKCRITLKTTSTTFANILATLQVTLQCSTRQFCIGVLVPVSEAMTGILLGAFKRGMLIVDEYVITSQEDWMDFLESLMELDETVEGGQSDGDCKSLVSSKAGKPQRAWSGVCGLRLL